MALREIVYEGIYSLTILGCVHTDTSTSTSTGPAFRLWPTEASLVRVERSRLLVQAHNSTQVGHIE